MTDTNEINVAHQFEIMETDVENIAKIIATFYQELKNNELPETLINTLVLQYAASIWFGEDDI